MTATIEYRTGDIFESGADYLVCPVNCVGTMGKGLALEFKKRYPGVDRIYQASLRNGTLHIGRTFRVSTNSGTGVVLFPTKWHWKEPSQLWWIDKGLDAMLSDPVFYGDEKQTIALPKLGCGLGDLDWEDVKFILEHKLNSNQFEYLNAHIIVYE